MNQVGCYYYNGTAVNQDYYEALRWFMKSAEAGNVSAYYNMGLCNEFGRGVNKNITEAKRWYKLAADKGDESAKQRLSTL